MGTEKIKCPVEGIVDLDRLPGASALQVEEIINTREFQRLRFIAQLGFTQYVYPGANHNRFSHSLGVFQGCQKALQQLKASGINIAEDWHTATALAALLHDLGHGPFSHTFEKVLEYNHEELTRSIICEGPELPEVLRRIDPGLAGKIVQILEWRIADPSHAFLSYLISSQMDCDRLDYLRRDSLHSGAGYGNFDRDWLLRGWRPSEDNSTIVLHWKGIHAAEQYLIGRYHMYKAVYFHKTTRAFECAFQGFLSRLRNLNPPELRSKPVGKIMQPGGISLPDFLQLTDYTYLNLIQEFCENSDPTIKFLAKSIIYREPLRCLESRIFSELSAVEREKREQARTQGLEENCVVIVDEPKDTPYKPYQYNPGNQNKAISLVCADRQIRDIISVSDTIKNLEEYYLHRVYYPRALGA